MTALERMAGMRGSVVITGAVTGVAYHSLIVNSDAVFTVFKTTAAGVETSQMSTMNLTGNTIKAGGLLTAPEGSVISAITITTGLVIGY